MPLHGKMTLCYEFYVFLRALHSKTQKTKNTHNNRLMKVTQIGSLGLEMLFSFVFFFSKNFEWFGTHISLQGLLQSALLGIWREPRIMKFCWETHEHCTLGLCRFVKIPFQINWKLHSHIGLKDQKQSFPTLCKGGWQKPKKHRNKQKNKNTKRNTKKTIFRESWLGPPFPESLVFFFLFDVFVWVLPLPLADAWGKIVFVLMVVQFLFLWSFFLLSDGSAVYVVKLRHIFLKNWTLRGFRSVFFWGGPTSYTCISRKALPPIYLYI